jgi:hypothetical protein
MSQNIFFSVDNRWRNKEWEPCFYKLHLKYVTIFFRIVFAFRNISTKSSAPSWPLVQYT